MAKVKYINCDIYKNGITVFIGTPGSFIDYIEKTYTEKEYKDFVEEVKSCSYGMADFHWCEDTRIVRLPKFPKTPMELAYTAHELLHATISLLQYCGVEFNERDISNEAYTYLLEYLMKNTLEKTKYEEVK